MKTHGLVALAALVLICGCGKSTDTDGDGILDSVDKCPNTPAGCQVTSDGCPTEAELARMQREKEQVAQTPPTAAAIPQVAGDTITTSSGLKYIEMTVGTGEAPQTGQIVQAHYTGWLTDGKKFDSSRDRGQTFAFPLGQGRVIKGWDEGIASMKVGGRRLLIIPPALGYGERGAGGVIPPNATLIFDVELVSLQPMAGPQ